MFDPHQSGNVSTEMSLARITKRRDRPMQELGMISLVNRTAGSLSQSALPNSPVVVERPPGRLRVLAAGALHRLADRLDGGRRPRQRMAAV
ncbi:hypothetical protein ACIA5D_30465 [Actinoplanes sp. NPDC051513]|uniref:hypothetical protein n=1 Tax=Actinoplanes sp. NPDC051513 TaxID=3363908 RepID=UPI0037B5D5C4